jgi:hypothetical protein
MTWPAFSTTLASSIRGRSSFSYALLKQVILEKFEGLDDPELRNDKWPCCLKKPGPTYPNKEDFFFEDEY